MKLGDKVFVYAFEFKIDGQKRPYTMFIPSFEDCIQEKEVEMIENSLDQGKMINMRFKAKHVSASYEKLLEKAKVRYKKDLKNFKKEWSKGLKARISDLEAQKNEWKAIRQHLISKEA